MGFVRQPVSIKKARKILTFLESKGVTLKSKEFREVYVYVDREEETKIYVFKDVDCPLILVSKDKILIPFVESTSCIESIPKVYVDSGAAKAVLRGADLMRPGINEMDEFEENDLVLIMYGDSPLAIGQALYTSREVEEMGKGKVIENLHYKGDKLWQVIKQLVR